MSSALTRSSLSLHVNVKQDVEIKHPVGVHISIRVLVMKGECLNVLYGHAGAIYSLCVLSTGVLVNGSVDTTIKLWDLETGEIIELILQGSP